jgi:uncharacterized protein
MKTLIGALALTVLALGSANAQTIGIVSTQPGSSTHSMSTAIAKVAVEKAGLQARVQAQGASPMYGIDAGTAEFGLSNSFDNVFFVTGTGDYESDGKHPNMRVVGNLTPLTTAMFVQKDSPVKSIKDLKGMRVGSGFQAQKTIGRIIEAHLALGGLTFNDVKQVPAANVVNGADDFGAGKTDVFFFATSSAKVKEIDVKVGGLRAISVENSPDAVARMQKILPGAYVMTVKPGPNMDGVLGPTNVVSFDFLLMSHTRVSEDVVYRVTKAIHGNKQILVETFAGLNSFDPNEMARPYPSLEYHPGAVKFYTEIGKWPLKK